MNILSSFAARSVIALSALTSACGDDISVLGSESADAAVSEISGDVSSRVKDAGIAKDSARSIAQPDISEQDSTSLPLEVSAPNDTTTPDTAVDIANPVTCETFDQLVAKGACGFDMAKSDALVIQDTMSTLAQLDIALSTTFKGITPTITLKEDNKNNQTTFTKHSNFQSGANSIDFMTLKFLPKDNPIYGQTTYSILINDNDKLFKQVYWWLSHNKKYLYPTSQVISMNDVDCGYYMLSHSVTQNWNNGKILSSTFWQFPTSSTCTPIQTKQACPATNATIQADCITTTGVMNPSLLLSQESNGDDSKQLAANAITLQQFKDLMKKYGIDIEL